MSKLFKGFLWFFKTQWVNENQGVTFLAVHLRTLLPENLLNMGIKWWNSWLNAQGSKIFIVVIQKIYKWLVESNQGKFLGGTQIWFNLVLMWVLVFI